MIFIMYHLLPPMKKILHKLEFYFDYYVGYFLYSGAKSTQWVNYMMKKYPKEYENEIRYLKEKEQLNK